MSAVVAMNEETRRIEQYLDVEANIKLLTTVGKGKSQRTITGSAVVPLSCCFVDPRYQGMRIFKNYSKGKITPHMMRHLYATVLYQESGHDAAFVQEQLRHSDVNTTLGTYAAGDSKSYEGLENSLNAKVNSSDK